MLAFLYTQNRVGGKIPSTLKIIEPITLDGQLELWGFTYPIDKVSSNQYVSGIYTLTYVDSSQVGNTPIQLCPKGISDGSDVGDNSKDRILATNGVPSEESHFYRVD